MKSPKLFLSYSWSTKRIANKIYDDLTMLGFDILKDDHVLEYKDKISEFMARICECDYAILIICDGYLKSINCMTEVMHIYKDRTNWAKVLPIITKETKIYSMTDRLEYIEYWQSQYDDIASKAEKIKNTPKEVQEELNSYKEVNDNIASFLSDLKDGLTVSPEELSDKFYSPLTDKMKVERNFTYMANLIALRSISDPNRRLVAIRSFVNKTKIVNSYTYSFQASCYRELGNPIKAIKLYKKAIECDELDYASWNNLGQIYQFDYHNYFESKRCYEKAIIANPTFDIPRLNLAVLLKIHYNDFAGAKEQNEKILEFDENNPKAHSNLYTIYHGTDKGSEQFRDLDKALMHLRIAANQDHLEAVIMYANYLKVHEHKIEEGNSYYRKAKELDIAGKFTVAIDALMKSNKG